MNFSLFIRGPTHFCAMQRNLIQINQKAQSSEERGVGFCKNIHHIGKYKEGTVLPEQTEINVLLKKQMFGGMLIFNIIFSNKSLIILTMVSFVCCNNFKVSDFTVIKHTHTINEFKNINLNPLVLKVPKINTATTLPLGFK